MPLTELDRRAFLQSLIPAACSLGAAAQPRSSTPLNVLILLADDLGWHDVGYHGSEIHTPNIDRLAAEGVRLERAYSFPVCSPTRSGLMTGRSPMRLGVAYTVIRPWSSYGVPMNERFMPQAFHDAGYQTAITGKWHLGHQRKAFLPRSRGFDHAYGHVNGAIDYFTHQREGGLDWNRDGKSVREDGYTTFLLGAEAEKFIRNRDRSKPFFLYVPFNSPHSPLQAPPEYMDKYANISDRKRRTFAAMVDAMDTAIGRLLKTLDDEKITDNTLVLFFSDNGGPVGSGATNTPLRGAKGTTFEGGIRVPAVLRLPGKLKPGVSQQVISMMDYFPTLAGACGVRPGSTLPLDGRNLFASLAAGKVERREDIFFVHEAAGEVRLAVHHGEWKLVRVESGANAKNLLFRIPEDPNETKDLASTQPELVQRLVARIAEWRKLHPENGVRETEMPKDWKAPKLWVESAS